MNSRTPLILGVLCLAVAFFVWKFESKWRSSDELRAVAGRVFPEFEREAVDRIEIKAPGGSILLQRRDTEWFLEEPVKYPANRAEVEQLLSAVEFLEVVETFEVKHPAKDLGQYGLERPRSVLRMSWNDKEEAIELRQGKDSAMGKRAYAQVQKGKPTVYVIDGGVFTHVEKTADDWRDRSVLPFSPSAVEAVTLTRDGKESELRRKDGTWHIMRPFLARASSPAVDRYLGALRGLQASAFVAKDNSDLKAFGLADPALKVRLKSEGRSGDLSVHFGGTVTNDASAIYARREDVGALVFAVPTNRMAEWNVSLDALRDPRVAGVDSGDVGAVTLRTGSNLLSAVRADGVWRLGGTNGARANGEAVEAFVQRVTALEASRFVADAATDLKASGFDHPGTVVTLSVPARAPDGGGKSRDGGKTEPRTREVSVELGRVSGDETLCRNSAEPFILAVTNRALEFLKVAPWDWRDVAVLDRKASDVTEVVVTTNGAPRVFTRTGTGWKTDGASVDETAMSGLLGQLTALRAQQWLGPQPPDPKARPAATYRFAEGTAAWELQVWPSDPDGSAVACLPAVSPLYFRLSSGDVLLLREPVVATPPAEPEAGPAK